MNENALEYNEVYPNAKTVVFLLENLSEDVSIEPGCTAFH